MEQYSVCKEFSFDAAHRLHALTYESKCVNLHGHKYFISLRLFRKELNEGGMIIDFKHFGLFEDYIDDNFDHATIIAEDDMQLRSVCMTLNTRFTTIPFDLTTSENIAKHLFNIAKEYYSDLCDEIEIKVNETPKNYASFRGFMHAQMY